MHASIEVGKYDLKALLLLYIKFNEKFKIERERKIIWEFIFEIKRNNSQLPAGELSFLRVWTIPICGKF